MGAEILARSIVALSVVVEKLSPLIVFSGVLPKRELQNLPKADDEKMANCYPVCIAFSKQRLLNCRAKCCGKPFVQTVMRFGGGTVVQLGQGGDVIENDNGAAFFIRVNQ